MSFWSSDLGEVTGNSADAFAKSFKQIPDNTTAIAKIIAFVNSEHNGYKYLNIDWLITDGDFKGQKVSQKIKVFDMDPKVRHRSLNMLKLIYQMFHVKPLHNNPPSDQDLSVFLGKFAGINIRETEPNDQGKQYNWVSEIHSAEGFKCETGTRIEVTHKGVDSALTRYSHAKVDVLDDEIPF